MFAELFNSIFNENDDLMANMISAHCCLPLLFITTPSLADCYLFLVEFGKINVQIFDDRGAYFIYTYNLNQNIQILLLYKAG